MMHIRGVSMNSSMIELHSVPPSLPSKDLPIAKVIRNSSDEIGGVEPNSFDSIGGVSSIFSDKRKYFTVSSQFTSKTPHEVF
jgi:hypothetical protein